MRIPLVLIGLAILLPQIGSTAHAQKLTSQEARFQPFLTRGETTWSLSGGARKSDYKWDVASDPTGTATPNIFNEQTFDDIITLELQAKVRHVEPMDIGFVKGGLLIEGQLSAGYGLDGNGRLSTYAGDNRTTEIERQTYNNLTGDSIGGALALGYQINLTGTPAYRAREVMKTGTPRTSRGRIRQARALAKAYNNAGPYLSITPLFGYAGDQQTFVREDAYEHISAPTGPFTTKADIVSNWYGPFIGLEGEIKTEKNMLRLRAEYHDLSYYAKRLDPSRTDWEQDPSTDQEADGSGILLNAEYAYALGKATALTIDANYREREAEDGTFTIYPVAGPDFTSRLNNAENSSTALHVGLRYNW